MGTAIGLYVFVAFILSFLFFMLTKPEQASHKENARAFLTILFWPIALPFWILFFVFLSIKILFKKDPKKLLEEKVKNVSIDELALKKRLLQENLELERELAKLKKD